MNRARSIVLTIFIALIILGFGAYLIINKSSAQEELREFGCNGIIDSIRQSKNHGVYYFLIKGQWENFYVYGDYVNHFAQPGDSLVKNSGDNEILIYKREADLKFREYKQIRLSVYPLQSMDK